MVEKTTDQVFIPITAGGGIRCIDDAYELLRAGADKVAINSGALKNPNLITEISKKFGTQCVVLSIQAKKIETKWVACYDSAREVTNLDVLTWAKRAEDLGAGEILLTSVDNDGTFSGLDIELTSQVSKDINIPLIACGGVRSENDFVEGINNGKADAVAIAKALHFDKLKISNLKKYAKENGIEIR